MKVTPELIKRQYEAGVSYKTSENLYEIVRTNEDYYAGDQWRGVEGKNLPKPVLNFIEQLVDVKISTLMSNQLTIHRYADDIADEKDKATLAAKAFNLMDKKNWERNKLDALNERALLNGALSGLSVSYWYWDNNIKYGNKHRVQGDFKGEVIDSINLYVSNPNDEEIQTQDWIILSYRKTLAQVKAEAKANGITDIDFKGEDAENEGFSKAENEQEFEGEKNITVLLRLWKEEGKVWACKTVGEEFIQKPFDTELSIYPIAIMQWKIRKRFIYGNAEITHIIANQQHINKMEAMRQLHAQLMAIPKVGYNKNMIAGFTNAVGGILPINAPSGESISNAIHYWQPSQMTIDVDKSIESTIQKTREFKGINDNVTGAARAENTSAIIAQQRAAGVPLESIKRRFYQYIEDIAIIWLEFYATKYNTTRKIMDIETKEEVEFKGTDNADVILDTRISVGASTQWSDALSAEALDGLLNSGQITLAQYLKRFPRNIIPEQDSLLEEITMQEEQPPPEEMGLPGMEMPQGMTSQPTQKVDIAGFYPEPVI